MSTKLDELLKSLTEEIPALSMSIGRGGVLVYSGHFGINSGTGAPITAGSRFDIASLTKILSGICFMRLVENGIFALDEPICEDFPAFSRILPIEKDGQTIDWADGAVITWRHVLTHTSGMGWTRPKTRPSLPHLDKNFSDILGLPLAYRPGRHVVYSDLGVILMGAAMEQRTGSKLDELVAALVTEPLELENTGYLRRSRPESIDKDSILPTEFDDAFRMRRIWGEVHDENCWLMDGVAAHAGIFSTAEDMCRLAMAFDACLNSGGILKESTAREMIREHAAEDWDRRGLIWQLNPATENAYTKYLSRDAYGHGGFTGCFIWTDPQTHLTVCLLSNDVYGGRELRRLSFHRNELMKTAVELLL